MAHITASPHDREAGIEVEDLTVVYGDFTAVDGIDLRVDRGEVVALLGTNGAGKTSTVEALEGHRRATGGTIRVLGLDPARNRRRLAGRVGMMLQESGFAGDLTVSETLRMWQRLHADRTERAAGSIPDPLATVDLDHRRPVHVRQLSGGERRRLDLALAISTDPEILFLDEPTTGLDPESRERTWQIIDERRAAGCGILLTTHYLEEAETLADRVVLLDRGRVHLAGSLAEVVAGRPARIRIVLPPEAATAELPAVSGTVERSGRELDVRTEQLQADLTLLLSWAADAGVAFDRLSATPASLAQVFAEVAGQEVAA